MKLFTFLPFGLALSITLHTPAIVADDSLAPGDANSSSSSKDEKKVFFSLQKASDGEKTGIDSTAVPADVEVKGPFEIIKIIDKSMSENPFNLKDTECLKDPLRSASLTYPLAGYRMTFFKAERRSRREQSYRGNWNQIFQHFYIIFEDIKGSGSSMIEFSCDCNDWNWE